MIVQAPSFVLAAGTGAIAPPGVIVWVLVELSETVYKSTGDQSVHPLALTGQEARDVFQSYGVVYIIGLVANVVVTAHDQIRYFPLEVVQVWDEVVHVLKLELQAGIIGPTGQIHAHDTDVVVVHAYVAALVVHVLDARSVLDMIRRRLAQDGSAAVALLLGWVVVLVQVARLLQRVLVDLVVDRFDFL